MRSFAAASLFAALGLAACQSPTSTPPGGAPPAAASSPAGSPAHSRSFADTTAAGDAVAYTCATVADFHVRYPTDSTAVVLYDGQEIPMKRAVSGSGSRYVGGGLEWHVKGDEGVFAYTTPDGSSGETRFTCGPADGDADSLRQTP